MCDKLDDNKVGRSKHSCLRRHYHHHIIESTPTSMSSDVTSMTTIHLCMLEKSWLQFPLIMIKENALINNYNCLSNALIKGTRLLAVKPPYAAAPICQICIYIQCLLHSTYLVCNEKY
jgi:hypothetical protein